MSKLLISPLSTYERTGWYCPDLVWFFFAAAQNRKHEIEFRPAHNFIPAAGGRNLVCKVAQERKADWILMVDNDMSPPNNLLDMLDSVTDDMDIVLPVFHMWDGDEKGTVKVVWSPLSSKEQMTQEELSATEWLELQSAGTGCIFIRTRVFEKLPYPWFAYEYNEHGVQTGTEDIPFIQQARKYGFRVWGNTRFNVGHYRSVDLSKINK